MLVKIKNQIFEIVDTKGNTLQNNDPVLKYVLKAISYILNEYENELYIEEEGIDLITCIYRNALENAGIKILFKQYESDEILDLD